MQSFRFISRLNILTGGIIFYLLVLLVFTILNYPELSANEGWGVVGIVGIAGVILTGFIVNLIIRNTIKSKKTQLYARVIALALYTILLVTFFSS